MIKIIALSTLIVLLVASAISVVAASEGDVRVGEQVVLRMRAASAGMTAAERATVIRTRLNNFLGSANFDPTSVKVQLVKGDYTVMIGNTLIVTVDETTAALNQCTREQLAQKWASNIRTAIPAAKAIPH